MIDATGLVQTHWDPKNGAPRLAPAAPAEPGPRPKSLAQHASAATSARELAPCDIHPATLCCRGASNTFQYGTGE